MANTYFQFKEFIVHQEHTAMKVCTDACLFGAWLAQDDKILKSNLIIDIGTGTGLLSLMLAQATSRNENPCIITAIEIEPNAAAEASSNFKLSPWQERLQLINDSIQNFTHKQYIANTEKFDCVISNPPFFEADLHSPDQQKNVAAHSTALPWFELIRQVAQLVNQDGYYYVLVPALRAYTMQKLAAQTNLQLVEELLVFNAEKQKPFRVIQKFKMSPIPVTNIKRSNFVIKDASNQYTENFIQLLAPYYLHL